MPKRPLRKITKRMVDSLSARGKSGTFWDRDLPGFGVRVYRSGRTTYVVQARGPHGSRRATIGRHGDLSPVQARKLAAVAIRRIKAGRDPIEPEPEPEPAPDPTVADLAERCVETYVKVRCRPHTLRGYRRQLRNHILPVLGERTVASVEQADIEALHHALRDRPAAADPGWGNAPALNPLRRPASGHRLVLYAMARSNSKGKGTHAVRGTPSMRPRQPT